MITCPCLGREALFRVCLISFGDNRCHISPFRGHRWRGRATSQRHALYRSRRKYSINRRRKPPYTNRLRRCTSISRRQSHTASYPRHRSTTTSYQSSKSSNLHSWPRAPFFGLRLVPCPHRRFSIPPLLFQAVAGKRLREMSMSPPVGNI